MRAFALVLLLTGAAQAQELSLRLSVEREAGAEQCAASPELQRRVDAILHRGTATGERAQQLSVDVHFARAPDGAFLAHVATSGSKPGQRRLRDSGATCDALSEAVSVAVALLLDARSPATADEDNAASKPAPKTHAEVVTSPPPTPRTNDDVTRPTSSTAAWQAQAQLGGGAAYGLGGAGALVGFASLGARGEHWLFQLGAVGSSGGSTGYAGGTVRTSLAFGSVSACYLLGHSWAIGPCATLGLGRLRGQGSGFGQALASTLPWTAGGLGLALQQPLGPNLFLALGANLWLPTRRQTFSVQNSGIAWESAPLAGMLSAGLGAKLF